MSQLSTSFACTSLLLSSLLTPLFSILSLFSFFPLITIRLFILSRLSEHVFFYLTSSNRAKDGRSILENPLEYLIYSVLVDLPLSRSGQAAGVNLGGDVLRLLKEFIS